MRQIEEIVGVEFSWNEFDPPMMFEVLTELLIGQRVMGQIKTGIDTIKD